MTNDYALVANAEKDFMVLHGADCPAVALARKEGRPIITILGCERTHDVLLDVVRHECLADDNVATVACAAR